MTNEHTRLVPTSVGPVACHVRGAGPAIVLLHANPGDARDFDAVVAALADTGRTVIRPDWPGYGDSPAPAGPVVGAGPAGAAGPVVAAGPAGAAGPVVAAGSAGAAGPAAPAGPAGAARFAQVLGEVLTELRADELGPMVLVGNSVGGYAALVQALREPARVAGLVLISPGGFTRLNPLSRALCRLMGYPATARWLLGPLASLYTWRRTPVARAALRRAYATGRDPQRRAVACAVWRSFLDPEHDLRDRVAGLPMPVLLTWGRGDPVLPLLSDGRRAARLLPGARLARFWCGHEPHAEVPEAWLAAVRPFLAELTPESRA
ncbi:alpha/beta fold hydrolase [Actinoplanes subtropicus]|uniref:alpha/beta fold hydrolase n=1 Tax=Actinoplanes subtropicus TaxID=543632 RepID=UPI0004C3B086|nr:alpha/beta hydrolase [Actinoplanes subtropicus]